MDRTYNALDRHFELPPVATVPASRPLAWLRSGWSDLRAAPLASLSYGLAFALAGWVILYLAADRPHLFAAAVSGFLLVGPLLSAGLYELSRRHGAGQPVGLRESFSGWTRGGESIAHVGLLLALIAIAWERLSAILFALLYRGEIASVENLFASLLFSGQHAAFLVAYIVVGGVLAVLVFALCAVSVPMIVDRRVDLATGTMTSVRCVERNLPAMLVWAALIVGLTAVGFATLLVGLILLAPLLGHATWHAYRDLVR